MPKEFNVYIDESGDEGINKGSKFFYSYSSYSS